MRPPLAIDLFCGLGGWTEGLLAAGYRVVGFDIERHVYGTHRYPAQLVLQDVRTIHGRQFKDAALIVASPPCQEYSYMAMPWSKAKQRIREYESGMRDVRDLTALFDACFRIQREACEADGRHIPLVVENVRGAQRWVGRSRWHFGSFHLWGDVPALMPIARGRKNHGGSWFNIGSPGQKETGRNPVHALAGVKVATMGAGWYPPGHPKHQPGLAFNTHAERAIKVPTDRVCDCGHLESEHGFKPDEPCNRCSCINPVWLPLGRRTSVGSGTRFTTRDCGIEGRKNGGDWFDNTEPSLQRRAGSKSPARKAASALIAKIPLVLSRHIGAAWHPEATA